MALLLSSRNLLRKAAHVLESGPARSTAISAVAGGVGLLAGKREDAKKVPIAALGVGVALNVFGLHTLGDGSMAGGATILGYRMGAKMARKESASMLPAPPRSVPAATRPQHAGAPGHTRRRG
jgi:hypothetical protein